MRIIFLIVMFSVLLWLPEPLRSEAVGGSDFPTSVRADYVLGCMASNGQTRDALEKCSCSIDTIANMISYQQYVDAETVMSLRFLNGEKGSTFRTMPQYREMVARLRRAQIEAELLCF